MLTKKVNISPAQCIANYIQDLEYQITDLDDIEAALGININTVSCGTPRFETVEEAWDYVETVKKAYFKLTGVIYGDY